MERTGIFKALILSSFLLMGCKAHTPASDQPQARPDLRFGRSGQQSEFSPSTLIIYYDTAVGKQPLLKAIEKHKAEILYDYANFNAVAIRIPKDKGLDESIRLFQKVKGVLSVAKDRIYHLD